MCTIEQIADCGDILSLARALFVNEKEDTVWLSQCIVSLSSCGNLLAVGYKKRLCFLTTQWISSSDSNTYLISWSGTLPLDVTAVLTLSICPSKHSSQNGPDWFCIVVGFQNGSVGFYTNTGHQLLHEKLDEKPVTSLSCHTGTYGTLLDDIHIFFQDCVCIVSGSNLFQTLRIAKANLAKVQAGVQKEYTVDSRSIHIRKWSLSEQEDINDAAVAGLELKNTYDHYLAASIYGGYDTWYRSIPPIKTLVLTAGDTPYIGFHYALEGGTTPPLQDVARAVANKIKSALPGWLGGSTEVGPTSAEPLIRAETLSMRIGVYDVHRHGTAVTISPDRRLAAFTDSLGRVAVLDINRGFIIRLFKGCRDAQCAFLQVFDADNKKPQVCVAKEIRRAIFLIIYNPKKGLIDIRLMQRGTRVAVFTATKNGRLLYNTCGLVGAEKNYTHKKLNLPDFQCVLIDPDGKLKKFNIPFYCSLDGEHLERSRDLHVLREIRGIAKKSNSLSDESQAEIVDCAAKLKTLDIKKHCLEILVKNGSSVSTILSCLRIFWDGLLDDGGNSNNEKIKNYFGNLTIITFFYRLVNNDDAEDMKDLVMKAFDIFDLLRDLQHFDEGSDDEIHFNLLQDDNCILERLLTLTQESETKEKLHAKVTFADNHNNNYTEFINAFTLDENNRYICLKPDLPAEKFNRLASDVFQSLFKIIQPTQLTNFLKWCNVDPIEIMKLIIIHLANMPLDSINIVLIEKFIAVVYYICKSSEEAIDVVYNEISPWWDNIRNVLVDLPCPLRSLIVAMSCKAVVKLFEANIEKSNDTEEAWESVTKENAKWGILIGKLEDISILSIILLNKSEFQGESLSKLLVNDIVVNLKYIYTRGQGSVTELIAKWLCSMGVPPMAIIVDELIEVFVPEYSSVEEDYGHDHILILNQRYLVDSNPQIFKWLSLLRRQFPLSTKAEYIVTNMCWEYAMEWQKNMDKTELLTAATQCISNVSDIHLKLGIFSIIWSTYIKQVFEACCRLVNKVGKLPKDHLCLQDLGFNSECLVNLLKIINVLLYKIHPDLKQCTSIDKKVIQYEKIWEESLPSLVEVAHKAKKINKDIFSLNFQLSCTVYYQCHFDAKVSKPLDTMFDVDYEYIIEALTGMSVDVINMNCSEKIKSPRRKFLTKILRKAIENISGLEDEHVFCKAYNEYTEWVESIRDLANLWNLDRNFVNHQNIIGLYHMGHDELVEKRLGSHTEPHLLLTPIVAISIQRLKRSLINSQNQPEWIVSISASLYNRLRNTELDTSVPSNPSLSTTGLILHRLLGEIEKRSPDNNDFPDYKLAEQIARSCDLLTRRNL